MALRWLSTLKCCQVFFQCKALSWGSSHSWSTWDASAPKTGIRAGWNSPVFALLKNHFQGQRMVCIVKLLLREPSIIHESEQLVLSSQRNLLGASCQQLIFKRRWKRFLSSFGPGLHRSLRFATFGATETSPLIRNGGIVRTPQMESRHFDWKSC